MCSIIIALILALIVGSWLHLSPAAIIFVAIFFLLFIRWMFS